MASTSSQEKRLLSLGANELMSGIATSPYSTVGGSLFEAKGWNPYVWPIADNKFTGTLVPMSNPYDLSADVSDVITAFLPYDTSVIYGLGDGGYFYSFNPTSYAGGNVTKLRSGANLISLPEAGIELFQAVGGSESIYYWQSTQIGKWNIIGTYPTGWTDNQFTGLTDHAHPTHKFAGAIYYGNSGFVGKLYDSSGTVTNSVNVLDVPANYKVDCLEDDGNYLIVGINRGSFYEGSRVLFWDTFSPSWNNEWDLSFAGKVVALRKVGNTIYAQCRSGLYALNFGQAPVKIRSFEDSPPTVSPHNAIVRFGEGVLMGSNDTYLQSYGKLVPDEPEAYFQPFAGFSGATGAIYLQYEGNFWFSTVGPKLYAFTFNRYGAIGTTYFLTKLFDLGKTHTITKVAIILGQETGLSSAESLYVNVWKNPFFGSACTFGSKTGIEIDTAQKVVFKRTEDVSTAGPLQTDLVALEIGVTGGVGGDVEIKRVDIYGYESDIDTTDFY